MSKNRQLILVLCVLFPLIICFGQKNRYIEWSDSVDSSFSWKMFNSKKFRGELKAYTETLIKFNIQNNNNNVAIDFRVYFDCRSSYVIEGSENKELLQHERVHFQIAELNKRLYFSEINGIKSKSFQRVTKIANRKFKRQKRKLTNMQSKYDRQTNHSQNSGKQNYWNDFIQSELNRLEKYKSSIITIEFEG